MEFVIIIGFISILVISGLLYSKFGSNQKTGKTRDNKTRLLNKVNNDLAAGNIDKAINRLTGVLENKPLDKALLDKLSKLLIQNNEFIKAGRILYLKENKSAEEQEAVRLFKNSVGNDPTLILKKIITKKFFRLNDLSESQLALLANLLNASQEKEKTTAKFLKSLDKYIEKKEKKRGPFNSN